MEVGALELARVYRLAHAPLTFKRLAAGIGFAYAPLPGRDGLLDPDRRMILLAAGQAKSRQRFTLAHEVMHQLLREDAELLSVLHEIYEGDALEVVLERLCNLGAAEILLPGVAVDRALDERGANPRLVPELAGRFSVSEAVVLVALAARLFNPSVAMVAGYRPLRLLEVQSRGLRRVATGVRVPDNHVLSEVYQTGLPRSGSAALPGGGPRMSFSAALVDGRVYVLFWRLGAAPR